jgi:hypothetical protein
MKSIDYDKIKNKVVSVIKQMENICKDFYRMTRKFFIEDWDKLPKAAQYIFKGLGILCGIAVGLGAGGSIFILTLAYPGWVFLLLYIILVILVSGLYIIQKEDSQRE